MMKQILAMSFFFCGSLNAQVQNRITTISAAAGFSFVNSQIQDQKYSKQIFTSNAPGYMAAFTIDNDMLWVHANANYFSGRADKDETSLKQSTRQFSLTGLFKLIKPGYTGRQWSAGIGPEAGAIYSSKHFFGFINSNRSSESLVYLAAALQAGFVFGKEDRHWKIDNRLSLPFLTSLSQSSFSGDKQAKLSFANARFLENVSMLRNRLSFSKMINQQHLVELSLQWQFYNIKAINIVKHNMQQLGLNYQYRFTK